MKNELAKLQWKLKYMIYKIQFRRAKRKRYSPENIVKDSSVRDGEKLSGNKQKALLFFFGLKYERY